MLTSQNIQVRHVFGSELDKSKPWLILGKGPSVARYNTDHKELYNIATINQALCVEPRADLASFVDYESFTATPIVEFAKRILMPMHPHWRERATNENLDTFFLTDFRLNAIKDRVYAYDLNSCPWKYFPFTQITGFNSLTILLEILATFGVKEFYTLGIDGGTEKEASFSREYRHNVVSYNTQFGVVEALKNRFNFTVTAL
jgi:hypothetical protein